uniref:Tubulin_C domain-containing protein n=1 Tax=Soboliphyme baturini TaxID=241478 RepID=A0A183J295_9BILA
LRASLLRIRDRDTLKFIPWAANGILAFVTKRSPRIQWPNRVSGLLLANHTGISATFESMLNSFDKLRKKKAFLEQFGSDVLGRDYDELDTSRERIQQLIEEYVAATKPDFEDWQPSVAKINGLIAEIEKLKVDTFHYEQECVNLSAYEKKAEELAREIRDLQGALADYNMVRGLRFTSQISCNE